jgi:hypothetical protein
VKDRYSPEPLNSFTDMRAIARQEVMAALSSGGSLASMSPGTVPFNAVILPFVTELPVVGNDGDEIRYLADDENGVVWHLRYRAKAPSDYRWEFIGGSALFDEVLTNESRTDIAFGALATAGPSITVPLGGEYDVQIGASFAPAAAVIGLMSYDIGSTAAVDADAVRLHGGAVQGSVNRTRRKELVAQDALVAKYRESVATGSSWLDRWMSVTPVRVGRP